MAKQSSAICSLLLIIGLSGGSTFASTPLTKLPVVTSGLSSPDFVTAPAGDTGRLFVVEQPGRIRIIKNGSLLATPFLDLTTNIPFSGEQGLLGLAFHPSYATNGYFFVNYTRKPDGATLVSRFKVSANPDLADAGSESPVITIPQPYSNHNGGMIAFGPNDHYLYLGMGDGGSGGDPGNRAQNKLELLGKILRLDIDTTSGYKIPPTNPFVGNAAARPEIWAFGVRNPWRFSFDRANADLYVGDVGQNNYEEIDYQPGTSLGGQNYGWRLKEGFHCYNPASQCDTLMGLTDPIYEYAHSSGGCAITGGYVYRGCAIPDRLGTYFFSDYCSPEVLSFVWTGTGTPVVENLTSQLGTAGMAIASFGEDALGELYIVDLNGGVYKIVPNGVPSACGTTPCCVGKRGNVNGLGIIDLADLSALVSYLLGGGYSLPCQTAANINGFGIIDLADLSALVAYLTGGSFALVNCT